MTFIVTVVKHAVIICPEDKLGTFVCLVPNKSINNQEPPALQMIQGSITDINDICKCYITV